MKETFWKFLRIHVVLFFAYFYRYVYTRYLDNGVLQGSFPACIWKESIARQHRGLPQVLWKVMTPADVGARMRTYQESLANKREHHAGLSCGHIHMLYVYALGKLFVSIPVGSYNEK